MKKSTGKNTQLVTALWIVGSYNEDGTPDIAAAAYASPVAFGPVLMVAFRPATKTHGNILARKAFTVNIPSVEYVAQADFSGLASGRDVNKFEVAGLTPEKGEFVDAPYVAEFPQVIECRLKQTVVAGSHMMFLGEVVDVKIEESMLDQKGNIMLEKSAPFVSGCDGLYHAIGEGVGKSFSAGKIYRDK